LRGNPFHDICRKTMGKLRSSAAKEGRTVTLVGALVNGVLIVVKFGAGILGQSQALIADAVHSLSDLVTDLIVFVGLRMGRKAPDEKHHFGHARIETLASFLVGVALIATAIFIGIKSSLDIYLHTESHPTKLALIGALFSILLKEWLYHYTMRVGRRAKSRLIVANAWHHRSDSLSSVAVVLGVGGSLVHPSWHALDSYAALLVSFFIMKVGLETLWESLREFTDTAPPPEVMETIRTCAMKVPGVLDMHDLRVRTSGGLYQMETHIVVDGQLSVFEGHQIAKAVEQCLVEEVTDVERVIVHLDPANA
jgi:cation diffusion facilitator family transporter